MPHFFISAYFLREENEMKQKTDLRVVKTRQAIHQTFKTMICEMDSREITVKELAERAQIHRKTFYLHYTSIESLYDDMLQEIANGYFLKVKELSDELDIRELTRVFFEYFSNQELYVERLICHPSYRDFCSRLFVYLLHQNTKDRNLYTDFSEQKRNLIAVYLISTTLELYRQWVIDKKAVPLNEVINLSTSLICNGIASVSH